MTFTRANADEDWTGTIVVLGKSYPLSLRASYEERELDEVSSRAKEFLEANWQRLLDQLTDELLPMHNEDWSDDDDPVLDKDAFLAAIGAPDVNVWEDDSIMLYFSDGGLFGGHYIELFVDGPEFGREVTVGIVG